MYKKCTVSVKYDLFYVTNFSVVVCMKKFRRCPVLQPPFVDS